MERTWLIYVNVIDCQNVFLPLLFRCRRRGFFCRRLQVMNWWCNDGFHHFSVYFFFLLWFCFFIDGICLIFTHIFLHSLANSWSKFHFVSIEKHHLRLCIVKVFPFIGISSIFNCLILLCCAVYTVSICASVECERIKWTTLNYRWSIKWMDRHLYSQCHLHTFLRREKLLPQTMRYEIKLDWKHKRKWIVFVFSDWLWCRERRRWWTQW